MQIPYFKNPKQVLFYDDDQEMDKPVYQTGIAYGDEIICACCGGVFSIEEIYDQMTQDELERGIQPIIACSSWVNINEAINGSAEYVPYDAEWLPDSGLLMGDALIETLEKEDNEA